MPEPVVLKPSWSQLKTNLVRGYSWPMAIGGLVVAIGSVQVLLSGRNGASTPQVIWTVVIAIVAIATAAAAYNFLGLLSRIEITDADLKFFTLGPVRAIPRTRIAGLVCSDVIGLLPHVMRFAILHDADHHALLALDRRYWSDHTLRRLEEIMGLPVALVPRVLSFRQFRQEWRR